jgi:hypothetical protein
MSAPENGGKISNQRTFNFLLFILLFFGQFSCMFFTQKITHKFSILFVLAQEFKYRKNHCLFENFGTTICFGAGMESHEQAHCSVLTIKQLITF